MFIMQRDIDQHVHMSEPESHLNENDLYMLYFIQENFQNKIFDHTADV